VSADGLYIAAQSYDPANYQPFLVYYDPTGAAGITNQAAQQASVDGLGRQRQALAIQHDAYAGILTGDLDRKNQANDVGVFGLVGSVVGGVHGHLGLGHGFSVAGGLMDGTSSFGGADIGNGLLGAAALRYDADAELGGFTPYAQLGGSFGLLSNVSFTRDYVGGTGTGSTDGRLASLYARLGVTRDFETGDQVSLEAEIGNRWLSTDAYAEAFSASNPFPAAVAAGTDRQTIGKLGGSWTHPLAESVDLTLRAALGTILAGASGLSVATTGFGTLNTGVAHPVWAELGAHLDWAVTASSSIDLYASAIVGQDSGNNAHVGAGYRFRF
jgi:hypothetical protein